MKRYAALVIIAIGLAHSPVAGAEPDGDGWVSLFDGKTMKGWKANENADTWSLKDGALVCHGPRSHIFYATEEPFVNFEFKAEVKTTPGSNAGIYFHTRYQDEGWPKYGFEVQVNNSHRDPKRTGSLYGVVDVLDVPAKDNEWYTQHIVVKGDHVACFVDGKKVMEYTQPAGKRAESDKFQRVLDRGTFALQGHDPNSVVYFRNIRVKRLP